MVLTERCSKHPIHSSVNHNLYKHGSMSVTRTPSISSKLFRYLLYCYDVVSRNSTINTIDTAVDGYRNSVHFVFHDEDLRLSHLQRVQTLFITDNLALPLLPHGSTSTNSLDADFTHFVLFKNKDYFSEMACSTNSIRIYTFVTFPPLLMEL